MRGQQSISRVALLMGLVVATSGRLSAAEKDAAQLLPKSTVLFVEMPAPAKLLETLLTHPLRQRAEASPGYQEALRGKELRQLKSFVAIYEAQFEQPWDKILAAAAGGGVYAAYDADSRGGCVLVRARDAAALQKLVEISLQLVKGTVALQGAEETVKTGAYRGITGHQVGPVRFAVLGSWLVVTNQAELGMAVLDRLLDDGKASLADLEPFVEARKAAAGQTVWAFADLAAVRAAGVGRELIDRKSDNPLAELLFGGIVDGLAQTPYLRAGLHLDDQQTTLSLSMPFAREWITEKRHFYWGTDGRGVAPPLLHTENTIAALTLHRDLHAMWMAAPDLFNEQINAGLAQADSQLTTLFAGRDFGDEILGAIAPHMQLVVDRQTFAADQPKPAIQLPAFALVSQLNEPEKMPRQLKITFQSLVGFLNVVGAMNGQPPYELEQGKKDGVDIVSATPLILDEGDEIDRTSIGLNFSPTIAFANDRFIISSSKQLAETLAKQIRQAKPPMPAGDGGTAMNFKAVVHFARLREALVDNQDQLVAQNMLAEGHSREAAQTQIATLLDLLGWYRDASIELAAGEREMTLQFSVRTSADGR